MVPDLMFAAFIVVATLFLGGAVGGFLGDRGAREIAIAAAGMTIGAVGCVLALHVAGIL